MDDTNQAVVLVVEDEPFILLNTVDYLESSGLLVLEAVNAAIALRILETRPDITHLFSDIDLPGPINGLELATLVRQRRPEVGIILTSGHMLPNSFELPDGVAFFPKPYRLTDVCERIAS